MSLARRKFIVLFLAVLYTATLVFIMPGVVQAEDRMCDCYCAIPGKGKGATSIGDFTSTDCHEQCDDRGYEVAACAFSSDQLPSQSMMCFTETTCSNQEGDFDSEHQPPECPTNMHYCYPTSSIETKLQVSIGGIVETGDYGEYVAAGYKWLVFAGAIFATVMIMIGGLQYTIAAGAGDTSKAKSRIKNGVVGITLLMFAYLILYTVNPQLLKLEVPKFPMIRQIQLVGGESCGYLKGVWGSQMYHTLYGAPSDSPFIEGAPEPKGGHPYTVVNATNGSNCGSVAEVTHDWEGNEMPAGTTCTFDYCDKEGSEQPRCVGTGENADCVTCAEVIPGGPIEPSEQVCGSIDAAIKQELDGHLNLVKDSYCFYTREADLSVNGWTATKATATSIGSIAVGSVAPPVGAAGAVATLGLVGDAVTQYMTGTCAKLEVDCNKIDSCRDYDDLVARNDQETACLDDIDPVDIGGGLGSLRLEDVCKDDPCKVRPEGEYCMFFSDTTGGWASRSFFPDTRNCVNSGWHQWFGSSTIQSKLLGRAYILNSDGGIDLSGYAETCIGILH